MGSETNEYGRYQIETTPHPDGTITQDTFLVCGEIAERIAREVYDTKDAALRDALIRLGWTPPDEGAITSGSFTAIPRT